MEKPTWEQRVLEMKQTYDALTPAEQRSMRACQKLNHVVSETLWEVDEETRGTHTERKKWARDSIGVIKRMLQGYTNEIPQIGDTIALLTDKVKEYMMKRVDKALAELN